MPIPGTKGGQSPSPIRKPIGDFMAGKDADDAEQLKACLRALKRAKAEALKDKA